MDLKIEAPESETVDETEDDGCHYRIVLRGPSPVDPNYTAVFYLTYSDADPDAQTVKWTHPLGTGDKAEALIKLDKIRKSR